ncbi:MAG: hypothetical protein M0P19_07760 [Nevskia sp.]|jgi:hypothetical protein|nr:hypothetical protein [Nevskia sp.]MCK9386253.1 hypothetical protein [Nevskia sp.]
MSLTPFEGFLAAMADSQFSWVFYLIAFFQTSITACHLIKIFRNNRIANILMVISSLIIPVLLIVGFYYATRSVA